MSDPALPYDKKNPFPATIKSRSWLSQGASERKTYHIVVDLEGSGYTYHVGDSVAILSSNDPNLVSKTLQAIGADGKESVCDKHGTSYTLKHFLMHKGNITEISRKLLRHVTDRQSNLSKRETLEALQKEENREALKTFLGSHQLWDFLTENSEVRWEPQDLVDLMMPMLPRFYSIASSQMAVGNEVHLTVANLRYNSNGHERFGVCTHYLCDLASLNQKNIPLYIQPHHGFTVPQNPAVDIIMVGPGTGVAPFRAFMQERTLSKNSGRNWLFFGEWRKEEDYFYRDFWETLASEGTLKIDTAFSRDQEHKIYVQHRMREQGQEIYEWLENGAFLYVCGDAHRMAKDVDATLHEIVQKYGNKSLAESKEYIKKMRADKRYLRDIY